MKPTTIALLCLALAGCETAPAAVPGARLAPPAPEVMIPPKALPMPKKGENSKKLLAQCRAQYAAETGKIVPLQRYIDRVTSRQ